MDRVKAFRVFVVLLFGAGVLFVGAPGAEEKAAAPEAAAPAAAPAAPAPEAAPAPAAAPGKRQLAPAPAPAKPAAPVAAPAKPAPPPKVGESSPNFTLKEAATGAEIELAKFRDKAPFTLITFTNSACSACRDEMDVLARLKQKQGAKINMLAIFTDMGGEAGATRARDSYKESFVYLMDPTFMTPPLYGFQYTPATVVLDKKGKVVYLKGGFTADAGPEFSREIAALLK